MRRFPPGLVLPLLCAVPSGLAHAQGSNAVIVSQVVRDGRVPIASLGLGDGGVGAPVVAATDAPGQFVSSGGVLVRAQRQGIKLDFPSGSELLVTPDGLAHLRTGEHTPTTLHVLELWLADGTRVRARRSAGRPFREVEVIDAEQSLVLWRGEQALRQPGRSPAPSGVCFLVVGQGDVLYRASRLGPLLTMERVLCPAVRRKKTPRHWLAVSGDVLAHSLRRLPDHVPPQSVQFPQAPQAAAALAQAADVLFPEGALPRPRGAVGELVFPLAGDFRLELEERPDESIWMCLRRGASDLPVVEWRAAPRTTLHLVRPQGGANGSPRYFLRGIDVTEVARELLPLPRTLETEGHARRVLKELGVRAPSVRPVPAAARR